jgi:lipocalin
MTKCIFLGIGPSSIIELEVAIIHAEEVKIERDVRCGLETKYKTKNAVGGWYTVARCPHLYKTRGGHRSAPDISH